VPDIAGEVGSGDDDLEDSEEDPIFDTWESQASPAPVRGTTWRVRHYFRRRVQPAREGIPLWATLGQAQSRVWSL